MRAFFLAACLGGLSTTVALAAPVQWTAAAGGNGHWYDYITTSVNQADALATSAASVFMGMTGHLVTITSAEEQAFLNTLTGGADQYWIAASDAAVEGTFEWIAGPETGQLLSAGYQNWFPGEPNNFGGEDGVHVNFVGAGLWNDIPDDLSYNYVVEYSAVPVPLPAAGLMLIGGLGGLLALRRKH